MMLHLKRFIIDYSEKLRLSNSDILFNRGIPFKKYYLYPTKGVYT